MKKKRIISIAMLLVLFAGLVAFLFPHPIINFDEPITAIKVIVAVNGVGKIDSTTYDYTSADDEFVVISDCLKDYSYHYSFGTLKSIISLNASNSSGMEGNNAGYWIHIYLDTDTERHTITCGGTGEIMIDDIVYRVGYFGNNKQLEMMEEIRSVACP